MSTYRSILTLPASESERSAGFPAAVAPTQQHDPALGFSEAMAAAERYFSDADYRRAAQAFADVAERCGDEKLRIGALKQARGADRLRQRELEQAKQEVLALIANHELEAAVLLYFRVVQLADAAWEEFQALIGIFERIGEWGEIAFYIAVFDAENHCSQEQAAWLRGKLQNAQAQREHEMSTRGAARQSYYAEYAPYPLETAFEKAASLRRCRKPLEAADVYAEITHCTEDGCARMRALCERAECHMACGYELDSLRDAELVLYCAGGAADAVFGPLFGRALALKLSISIDLGRYFVVWQSRELIVADRKLWALYDLALVLAARLYEAHDEEQIRTVQSAALADEGVLFVWMREDVYQAIRRGAQPWPARISNEMCLMALSGFCSDAMPLVPRTPEAQYR